MMNKMFTTGEVVTIKTNLRAIENYLGHPIPGGVVNVNDLKDHILRGGEVVTYCHNLKTLVDNRRRYNNAPKSFTEVKMEIFLFALFVLVGSIVMLF